MIFERVVGPGDQPGGIDPSKLLSVELHWSDCHRRAVRARTACGQSIGILVPLGQSLRDGDVLATRKESGPLLHLRIRPAALLRIVPRDTRKLMIVCLELGNAHVPVEVRDGALLAPVEGPVYEIVRRLGLEAEAVTEVFQPLRTTARPPVNIRI